MVVLEGGGSVVTIGNNQYLQPDYLSPLPTTLDSKKSPLALLAQTCSQIGADSSAVKPSVSSDKKKMDSSSTSKSPSVKTPKSVTPSSTEVRLAFKPYETNVLSHQHPTSINNNNQLINNMHNMNHNNNNNNNNSINHNNNNNNNNSKHTIEDYSQQRPNSKSSVNTPNNLCYISESDNLRNSSARVPSRNKSNSPEISVTNNGNSNNSDSSLSNGTGGKTTPCESRKTVSPAGSSQRGASPIIRSGMEILHGGGHPKDMQMNGGGYKPSTGGTGGYGLNPLTAALCCPPGMEQHQNPAFRPPFAGAYTHQHAAMLAAAAGQGYPTGSGGGAPNTNHNPYISYQRIKTPSGGEAIVPVCKDPYCPGCPYSAHTQQMLMGAPCPSGCTQCEHQKYGLAMAASLGSLPPGHPYASAAAAAAAAASAQAQMRSPYVCSWITGDAYCGKRFNTSDELFSHLRTHTGNLSDPAAAAAALAQSQAQSLLSSLFPPSAMQRGYPTPPLSPMSAARYHPYGKPSSIPQQIPGSPFGAGAFNPAAAAAAALGPYYSPYAMYGQRIGSATVHQ